MTDRRTFMKLSGASLLAATLPAAANTNEALARRAIRGGDETLAVIGLGNSSAFRGGDRPVSQGLLKLFFEHGGNYIDASGSTTTFVGGIAADMGAKDQAFFANYIDPTDLQSMKRSATTIAKAQGKTILDLVHTRDIQRYLSELDSYRALKEEGLARHIGIARSGGAALYDALARLIDAQQVDFIQVNYSIMEPGAGDRLLPLAQDKGIGVAINRPFINGNYFRLVQGHELPEWATEFDCESWAQFSLKYILSNPAVNCVLTETTNPKHALDNIGAGYGRLPDAAMRKRMADHLRTLS